MPQCVLFIYFVISLLCIVLHGSRHSSHTRSNKDDLQTKFHPRAVTSFTTAQRQVQKQMLKDHNALRLLHCAPELKLDDELNRLAQDYANTLAKTNKYEHSDLYHLGENLFRMRSSSSISDLNGAAKQASKGWYDENSLYNFDKAEFSDDTGHLTQLLWKESERLGVGYALGKLGSEYTMYIVALYDPPGNTDELFLENVLSTSC
ncbi:hypothetical protein I4U23_008479 [Adineta vaga]|nr:hypothetical protein I4U23_008479 [Adineta vaga]